MEQATKKKRRRFSKVQKKRILEAFSSGQMTCTELAGQHRINPVLIYRWRRAMAKEKGSYISNEELIKQLEEAMNFLKKWEKYLSPSLVEEMVNKISIHSIEEGTLFLKSANDNNYAITTFQNKRPQRSSCLRSLLKLLQK